MGICEGCAVNFTKLAGPVCLKCQKLQKADSDVERLAIENQPQCMSCSVVFPFMKNSICGGCATQTEPTSGTTTDHISDSQKDILSRSIEYQKSASQHRLNQPLAKQNANLQAATAKKEALSALKKMSRSDIISIVSTLNAYPLKGAVKKHITLLTQKRWPATTHAKIALMKAKDDLKAAYSNSPATARDGAMVLNFEQVTYGILKSTKSVYSFTPTEENLTGTIDQLFHHLNDEGKLSDSDVKNRNISLELYVYELEMEDSPVKPTRQYTSSYYTSQAKSAKRKASGSISSNDPYVSGYHPQKSAAHPIRQHLAPEIEYKEFTFSKTTYSTDADGNVNEHIHKDQYTIKIAHEWQKDIGDMPKNGYVAKGLTKYVFRGLFDGKPYAIFQCKPIRVTDSQNLIDLTAELRLLSCGQYFADSFVKRAAAYNFSIPAIRWNCLNAFIGSVKKVDIGLPPNEDEADSRSLIFPDFLATPLLSTAGLYTERKFSGCNEAGNSVDDIGRAIDAFAHHVLVDSHGSFLLTDLQGLVGPDKEVILFDPQAHFLEKNTGFWDRGREGIVEWLEAHKCRSTCKKLGLTNANLAELDYEPGSQSKPLRTGWPSPPLKATCH